MARKRLDQTTGEDPTGVDNIAYDRTNPVVDDPTVAPTAGGPDQANMLAQLGNVQPGADPTMGQGAPDATAMGLSAMDPSMPDAGTTDQLSDVDLAALDQAPTDLMNPEELQVQQLEQALTSPETSPQERAQIEAQLALSARRKLAGL